MTNTGPKHQQTSMSTGMVLNLASLGFLAVAGLFLNFAIARFYGEEMLGLFNMALRPRSAPLGSTSRYCRPSRLKPASIRLPLTGQLRPDWSERL